MSPNLARQLDGGRRKRRRHQRRGSSGSRRPDGSRGEASRRTNSSHRRAGTAPAPLFDFDVLLHQILAEVVVDRRSCGRCRRTGSAVRPEPATSSRTATATPSPACDPRRRSDSRGPPRCRHRPGDPPAPARRANAAAFAGSSPASGYRTSRSNAARSPPGNATSMP